MSNVCIVSSCNTRRNTDRATAIKCFSFPKDPDIRRQWLNLCQVKEDHNRKICIKHFKEDDFVDGLRARLMSVQPKRLKKDAIPSLFLNPEISEEARQRQIQEQEEMLKNYMAKKKRQVGISKVSEATITNPSKGTIEYLSKLVPIAPKGQGVKRGTIVPSKDKLIGAKEPVPPPKWQKIAIKECILGPEESSKVPICQTPLTQPKEPIKQDSIPNLNTQTPKTLFLAPETNKKLKSDSTAKDLLKQIQPEFSFHQLKILQHDNAIYKKRINTLVDNQNKLLARIKELETKMESQKEDFIGKVKETFANVLTSNQIDNILHIKKHIWWTNDEYSKALELLHISKPGYNYVRDKLNYPLPCITNVYKWSTRNELTKISDENKENGVEFDDEVILDDDEMLVVDVNSDMKSEYEDEEKNIAEIEYDHDLDDKEYTIKIHTVQIDQCDIEYENVDYNDDNVVENGDGDSIEIDQLKFIDEYGDADNIEADHNIVEHERFIHNNQSNEFYEELIIDNDYSDNEIFIDLQNVECIKEDNG